MSKDEVKLPKHLEEMRTRVFIDERKVSHVSSIDDSAAYASMGFDNGLTFDKFKKNFAVEVVQLDEERIQFDLIGVDAPIANAFRRVMLAEVPSMAIDKVVLYQNTSIIQDEVLAHRLGMCPPYSIFTMCASPTHSPLLLIFLSIFAQETSPGLIPIMADPRQFKFLSESQTTPAPNEENTTVFTLHVVCSRNNKAPPHAPAAQKYHNSVVLSKDLVWVPQGSQADKFKNQPVAPSLDDIVIAKLRPGQEIEAELHVQKGVGHTHAKFSPVCTAAYRLHPEIVLPKPVTGELAQKLVDVCPLNVFDIEDLGGGKKGAKVARARDCTLCRECIRSDDLRDRVNLRQIKDHFIFSVESVGAYKPEEILHEAIKVFTNKCENALKELGPAQKRGRVDIAMQ